MTSTTHMVPRSADASTNSSIDMKTTTEPFLEDPKPPPREPIPDEKKGGDQTVVDFEGPDDPLRPMNWTLRKKIRHTLLYGLTTTWITFASAVYSAGLEGISQEFNVSSETAAAGVSLLVFGFAVGPLLWAPLSEMYGRKWVVMAVKLSTLERLCLSSQADAMQIDSLISSPPLFRLAQRRPKTSKRS